MVVVPVAPPQTTPAATVAIAVLLLLHAPPGVASANVVQVPTHTLVLPVIGPIGFTVITFVVIQVPMA
jgi:hypothetical protein